MKVKDRLEPYPACDAINLDKDELEIYSGAGWHIAGFRDGKLDRLHSMDDYEMKLGEDFDSTVKRATKWNLAKLDEMERDGLECWVTMCSCAQLCEPEPVKLSDAVTSAKFARRIGEGLLEI